VATAPILNTKNCSANLHGLEGHCAAVTAGNAALAGVADAGDVGIIESVISNYANVSTGLPCTIVEEGECWAVAGAAFAEDAWLAPNAAGRLIAAVAGQRSNVRALGPGVGNGIGLRVAVERKAYMYLLP